ncbi:Fic family protein [Sphingomonas sp. Leaf412]|uniref:Fic family protein n=1 Tax=Sphingomonas sp. Leaf412 TaxID=1736370 RepID=UPI0009E9DE04|nr:Fic family protein [Sphingomonas sp. Leaf412]
MVREEDDKPLFDRVQEQNLLRQYDLLSNCVEIGLSKGVEAFDNYTLWALNAAAVSNIAQFGGRYREEPIYVGDHIPPHFDRVADLMDRCISVVHENWSTVGDPVTLPAFVLWRMNWIHPFVEGNGRTARAACYYLLCLRYGDLLPGVKTVPERIRENRPAYYAALKAADQAWAAGHFDVSELRDYLTELVRQQLAE